MIAAFLSFFSKKKKFFFSFTFVPKNQVDFFFLLIFDHDNNQYQHSHITILRIPRTQFPSSTITKIHT